MENQKKTRPLTETQRRALLLRIGRRAEIDPIFKEKVNKMVEEKHKENKPKE